MLDEAFKARRVPIWIGLVCDDYVAWPVQDLVAYFVCVVECKADPRLNTCLWLIAVGIGHGWECPALWTDYTLITISHK